MSIFYNKRSYHFVSSSLTHHRLVARNDVLAVSLYNLFAIIPSNHKPVHLGTELMKALRNIEKHIGDSSHFDEYVFFFIHTNGCTLMSCASSTCSYLPAGEKMRH